MVLPRARSFGDPFATRSCVRASLTEEKVSRSLAATLLFTVTQTPFVRWELSSG